MKETVIRDFGKAVREHRIKKVLTQEQLSLITGISKRHIANIEKGLASPTLEIIKMLCNTLDFSADSVLKGISTKDLKEQCKELMLQMSKYTPAQRQLAFEMIEFVLSKYHIFVEHLDSEKQK